MTPTPHPGPAHPGTGPYGPDRPDGHPRSAPRDRPDTTAPRGGPGGVTHPVGPCAPAHEVIHGHLVEDPFRWLEDPAAPATLDWLAHQDRLSDAELAALPGRHAAARTLSHLMAYGGRRPERRVGTRVFREVVDAEAEFPALAVFEAGRDDEPVVLWRQSALASWEPAPDGRTVACQILQDGREDHTPLLLLDVATGEVRHRIPRTRHSPVAWLPDGSGFFHARSAADGGPQDLWLHRHGRDRQVWHGSDDLDRYRARVWHGRWLTVEIRRGSETRNRLWLADLGADPARPVWTPLQEAADAVSTAHVARNGTVFVATTHGAPDGQVVVVDRDRPGPDHWTTVIPEEPGAPLTHLCPVDDADGSRPPRLLVARTLAGSPALFVHHPGTRTPPRPLPLPPSGTVLSLESPPHGGVRLGWTSWTTPPVAVPLDPDSAPGVTIPEAGPQPLEEWRESAPSADGTGVPLTLLAHRGRPSGPLPTLLLGYGGFGRELTSSYESLVLAWVRAGGLVVVPDLRGPTAAAGKHSTFEDLEAVADHLRRRGLGGPDLLALVGMSNGGLTMAAAMVRDPDRYAAVVCVAPLTDMVRYERSGLGRSWRHEFGSAADPDQFRHLLSYSPYHRIEHGLRYPPTLLITLHGDTRVAPLHARKFCARLQRASSGRGPYLLRSYGDSGHTSMARGARHLMSCDVLSFAAHHTGLDLTRGSTP
ncbi:prolyl endopeptidase [Streptomyces kronopolitis]|uniref:prolyl oligopeptidase n=1 Tax=Streptomyces kronopolitis TaxID=1612435 RepID=A0ABQ2IXC3_9ACTN|nr:prolyl oligopeptidase family serine peptidase [Streptomyces kronopolitis]GGN32675.1 prolyl endopeptidase [Streptomyces kronopolitis]